MKSLTMTKLLLLPLSLLAIVLAFTACSRSDRGPTAITQYTCPMHPDVVQDKPGKCPKCGMSLVKKT